MRMEGGEIEGSEGGAKEKMRQEMVMKTGKKGYKILG